MGLWKNIKWLFTHDIEEEFNISKKAEHVIMRDVNALVGSISHNERLIKSFLATCQTGYDIGVTEHHRNYVVFVKHSKTEHGQDFVKFIDLSHLDLDEIVRLEKELEYLSPKRDKYSRHIDAPMGMKDYFIFS